MGNQNELNKYKKTLKNLREEHKSIAIIPNLDPNYNNEIPVFYKFLEESGKSVMIIQPADMICSMKLKNYDYFLIFCPVCLHSKFNTSIAYDVFPYTEIKILNDKLSKPKKNKKGEIVKLNLNNNNKLNIVDYVEYDGGDNNKHNDFYETEKRLEINEDNLYLFPRIKQKDFTSFLISRLGQIEKAKSKKVFNIIFTNPRYLSLSQEIENYIIRAGIVEKRDIGTINSDFLVYKTYLMDISYERLTAVDNIEVIVLIDCPYFIPFDNQILIPLLTPFDIFILFGDWKDGKYFPNKLEPIKMEKNVIDDNEQKLEKENSTVLVNRNQISSLNQFFNECKLVSVPFFKEEEQINIEEDDKISDGRKGIACEYEKEGQDAKK